MNATKLRAAARSWYTIHNETEEPDTAEVLIYEQIGESFWGGGVGAKQFAEDFAAITAPNINVRINSPGGMVFEGYAIANAIERHPSSVTTHIDGLAASIASVIALAGDKVVMASNGLFMIHEPWSVAIGPADELRKEAALLDKISGQIIDIYEAKSGQPRDDIAAAMNAETWYTAAEALELGYVDEVTGASNAQDSFDLSPFNFRHYPGLPGALAPAAAATIPAPGPGTATTTEREATVTTATAPQVPAYVPVATTQDPFPYRATTKDERGQTASMFRDAYRAQFHRDDAAAERFQLATRIMAEAGESADIAEIIPTQYRPDLYVGQLPVRRPVIEAYSRGSLDGPNPIRVPKFSLASGLMADHVENTNPTDGVYETTEQIITPKAVSGQYTGSREQFEGASPAFDGLVLSAIKNEYAADSEAYAAAVFLAGATAGTAVDISNGVTADVLQRMITFNDTRKQAADSFLAGTSLFPELVKEKDGSNRPMNPIIGATNASGQAGSKLLTVNVAGYETPYCGSIAGGLLGAYDDALTWESGLRTWVWEEVVGPAQIRIASFGYIVSAVLRAAGLLKFSTQA